MKRWWAVWSVEGFPFPAEAENEDEAYRLALVEMERQGTTPLGPHAVSPVIREDETWDPGIGTRRVRLENGRYLRLVGDGSAHDSAGNQWLEIMAGKGEPDKDGEFTRYRVLGWAEK